MQFEDDLPLDEFLDDMDEFEPPSTQSRNSHQTFPTQHNRQNNTPNQTPFPAAKGSSSYSVPSRCSRNQSVQGQQGRGRGVVFNNSNNSKQSGNTWTDNTNRNNNAVQGNGRAGSNTRTAQGNSYRPSVTYTMSDQTTQRNISARTSANASAATASSLHCRSPPTPNQIGRASMMRYSPAHLSTSITVQGDNLFPDEFGDELDDFDFSSVAMATEFSAEGDAIKNPSISKIPVKSEPLQQRVHNVKQSNSNFSSTPKHKKPSMSNPSSASKSATIDDFFKSVSSVSSDSSQSVPRKRSSADAGLMEEFSQLKSSPNMPTLTVEDIPFTYLSIVKRHLPAERPLIFKVQVGVLTKGETITRVNSKRFFFFSAPEPKAQVHYCDHALSSVRPSVVNFSHFRLLLWNRWTEFNQTWQEARSQRPLPSLCFLADLKNKMAALASDWLRHFRLLLWNSWTEFNETWQEARFQCPLPSLCFSGRSEKQDGRPALWLAETFSTSPLKPLNRIQRNLTGSKISTSSTKFVFFGPIRKTRWPPWPLIGWDIFDFSSETAEQNLTKLYRKQDLNVLYQVCVFRVDRKNKMAIPASDWLRHFRLLLWNRWTEFNETWQEARSQCPLPSFCFSCRSEKQDGRPGLWLAETFSTSPLKPLNGIQRNLTGSKISMFSTKFLFFGPIGITRWPPWPLIGWDIFDFSSETAEQSLTKLDTKQDLNVLYQVCVFRANR